MYLLLNFQRNQLGECKLNKTTYSQLIKIFIYRNAVVSDCGKYAIFNVVKDCRDNLVYFANLGKTGDIKGKLELTQVVHKFESDYDVSSSILKPVIFLKILYFSVHNERGYNLYIQN